MSVSSTWGGRSDFPATEAMLLLVAIFWGTSYGMTKSALLFTSVFMFLAIRFLMTFALLLIPTIQDFRASKNKDWQVALPTGLILLAIFCCEVLGVSQTTATNAAFLISLSIVLTALVEVLVNRQRLNLKLLALACASVIGVGMLTFDGTIQLSLNTGDRLILLAALLRALMVTTTKRFTEGKQVTTLSLTALQSLVVGTGALIMVLFQHITQETVTLPMSTSFWMITLYLVICCTLFAFFAQNYAVRRTSPTRVSLLMGSEPLFGALFATIWLGESLTLVQYLGGAIILSAVTVASLSK
ncbi:DMT family transporter [Amphritea pacifica]|uniref:EamA family transporter n=1 Tax=Amphritea pacifica TaxID=2811233 RepID=A0ABS2WEB7_9GAMM|nr:EamA family transporter [Amphritea pacifica]MBN0989847.1 EamA family transporter [Amphritea pacifica]MBN1009144.1 EamA family transporter [Amphritea pacifica]